MDAHPAERRQPAGGHRQDPDLPGGLRRLPAPALRLDGLALPVEMALEQVELLGTEVVPVLRKEMAARRAPGVPDAPTHASLVTREVRRRRAAPAATEPEPRRQPLGRIALPGQRPRRRGPLPAGGVTMTSDVRLANEAWEAYYRAQATLAPRVHRRRHLGRPADPRVRGALRALQRSPTASASRSSATTCCSPSPGCRASSPASRPSGLVERIADADDGRARRIRLTAGGCGDPAPRRRRTSPGTIAGAMTRALDTEQLDDAPRPQPRPARRRLRHRRAASSRHAMEGTSHDHPPVERCPLGSHRMPRPRPVRLVVVNAGVSDPSSTPAARRPDRAEDDRPAARRPACTRP